jgi:hypothetical protein
MLIFSVFKDLIRLVNDNFVVYKRYFLSMKNGYDLFIGPLFAGNAPVNRLAVGDAE